MASQLILTASRCTGWAKLCQLPPGLESEEQLKETNFAGWQRAGHFPTVRLVIGSRWTSTKSSWGDAVATCAYQCITFCWPSRVVGSSDYVTHLILWHICHEDHLIQTCPWMLQKNISFWTKKWIELVQRDLKPPQTELKNQNAFLVCSIS